MLQAKAAPDFWEEFAKAPDPRKAFREAIELELPAFADFLLKLSIPTHLQSRRYGVKSFIPEDLAQSIFEGEPEHLLQLLVDKEIFREDRYESGPWRGDAEDLKQALCAESSAVRASASRLLSAYPTARGQYLGRLASNFPARFQKHRTATKREWIIHPPSI